MDATKRAKPGLARSLLQRVSSRQDVNEEDGSRRSEDGSALGSPVTSSPLRQTATSTPQQASIEHSVRLFRLYEALRSGDTAAISKALKDGNTAKDGEPRQSSSELGTSPRPAGGLEGTSILHLAVQCADLQVIEYVLSSAPEAVDVNFRDKDGNTALHVASSLSRAPVVRILLRQRAVNTSITNYQGKTALDLAKSPDVYQQLQLARSMFIDSQVKEVQRLVAIGDYDGLEQLVTNEHFQSAVDVNGVELATDQQITESGGTLLHEAAKRRDMKLIQLLLLNGADPFRRDRKGKLPQDITKDDKTRAILKKSPAAAAAQRGVQEKAILGSGGPTAISGPATGDNALGGKEGREMKGYLKKWVNYTTGYKLRWFVLEDGVLSYYKHQDDAGSACRGAINMKIAKLHMDAQDKLRFEIIGKSSVKYHLKANHQVEAKRWFWALNNAIQFSKDEAKDAERQQNRNNEMLRQAKMAQSEKSPKDADSRSVASSKTSSKLVPGSAVGLERGKDRASIDMPDDDDGANSTYDASLAGDDVGRMIHSYGTTAIEGDLDDDEEFADDASAVERRPANKDAFMIAAHSARLQLDLLGQISSALHSENARNPTLQISDPVVGQALASYEAAVANLKGLIGDLGRITRDRETYWNYRLEQEISVRRVWEESMQRVAKEQEELENRIGESEEKRKRTKRALRDALEGNLSAPSSPMPSADVKVVPEQAISPQPIAEKEEPSALLPRLRARTTSGQRKRSCIAEMTNISDTESDDDEEFFDAVDAGEVEVVEDLPTVTTPPAPTDATDESFKVRMISREQDISSSFKGYEDPVRRKLKMDQDNRPKISLWGILKSMIGKDMTKMTLPVSFNEPTSLLQRVAEDMEYTDLLDIAADRTDPTERMLYVAAFAASEYASTVGRVAKPFNPLLGETYEYARPDKGFRFFVEQVSHHPPVGAAWAEASKWEYYGESAVKSKFYGKSFDINPLGTWFLKLRPTTLATNGATSNGEVPTEELYTWKKVTSSVVGIITGSPTVDNYGPMEIRNHTSGEVCLLEFKQRGWKASSAYQVSGKVIDNRGNTRWSIGGRWNDKIYARLTPGFEADSVEPPTPKTPAGASGASSSKDQAFLVWEAHARPANIPFNLTPFVVTLNALTENLRPRLPPTDTRLRPDQRAMEDGEYDFAATEKNRVEEKQRAKRRARESRGDEYAPKWFVKRTCPVTNEEYWHAVGADGDGDTGIEYWTCREGEDWSRCEDIF